MHINRLNLIINNSTVDRVTDPYLFDSVVTNCLIYYYFIIALSSSSLSLSLSLLLLLLLITERNGAMFSGFIYLIIRCSKYYM